MRKRLYTLYNYLASYPVIALLLAATVLVVYNGRQYRPFESKQQALLLQNMELSQERQELREELNSLRQEDLRKRYILFNQDFLSLSEANADNLENTFQSVFTANGWVISSTKVVPLDGEAVSEADAELEEAAVEYGVQGREWVIRVSAPRKENEGDENFLPLYSLTQCIRFLWSRSPVMECRSIELSRLGDGYEATLSFFLPLRDPNGLNEPLPAEL
ncbi:MAG: hypothetical protein NWT02_10805 [Opitutales bacterium]|nr:hypothetical protein [Opitutales bacterium]MDP4777461.1 hypothetical protein [Opitutales bacterium]MDP4884177.1 hypothetical protein [Opitutales bacterium]